MHILVPNHHLGKDSTCLSFLGPPSLWDMLQKTGSLQSESRFQCSISVQLWGYQFIAIKTRRWRTEGRSQPDHFKTHFLMRWEKSTGRYCAHILDNLFAGEASLNVMLLETARLIASLTVKDQAIEAGLFEVLLLFLLGIYTYQRYGAGCRRSGVCEEK